MAYNNLNGPPPQEDPKNPNFICSNCHNNIYELCDECMERVDVQEIFAMMKKNKGRPLDDGPPLNVEDESRSYVDHMKVHDSTEPPNTTPNNTQTMSENDTSDSQRECEEIHVNPSPPQIMDNQSYCDAQGGPSAVLVSITRTDSNNYRYEFKYEPPNTTPNTTPDNTQTMSENDTSNSQREYEGIHKGHDMDSDNFNYDDPITPGGFFLTPEQQKPDDESPFYDSDGNEVTPGLQL